VNQALAAAAGFGLPGAQGPPDHALDGDAWLALVDDAARERVLPLLATAIAAGAFPATADQREQVYAAHEQVMHGCLLLERSLLEVAGRFDGAGIPFRVLKGTAVAHLDYPDPAWRAFGDVDLLVPGDAYDAALALLAAHGARRRYREVRPGFDRRFGKGSCLLLEDGTQVDVHRSFVAGPFGLSVDLDALFADTQSFTIGDRELPALTCEHRFLHACFHAALGDAEPRLAAQRDVAQFALSTGVDLAAALTDARRWRADGVVARALAGTWARLGLAAGPASRWAERFTPDRFQARALRAYTGSTRSYAAQTAAGLAAVHGVREKAAYLRAVLVADRAHVARHDGGYAHRLRRGWAALRSTRAGS
jgi:hypothetical protein